MISSKKRVLLICQLMPAASGSGVAMRLYNWAHALSQENDLTILLVSQEVVKASNLIKGIDAKVIFHDNQKLTPISSIFKNMLQPEMHKRWDASKLTSSLRELESQKFDVVVVSRLRLAPVWNILKNKLRVSSKKTIIDFDDIESVALWRKLCSEYKDQKLKQIAWTARECIKLYLTEITTNRIFDCFVTCSEIDANKLQKRWFIANSTYVPNCVQTVSTQKSSRSPKNPNILFVGTLNYPPNEQGIKWFTGEAWKSIKNILKSQSIEPTLTIVGKNPTPWMSEINPAESISVYGNVDSVTPFYEKATLVICPIFQGGGTRIKILEAFAHSRAVVSTKLGAEGIDAMDNEHIILADTTTEFVAAITGLLQNHTRLRALEKNAFELFNDKYSPKSFIKHVSNIIK